MRALALILGLSFGLPSTAAAQELTLAFHSKADGGRIAIAVHADADNFRRGEAPLRDLIVPRTGPVTTVTLRGLPPGRYAVAAFHDLDGDGELTLWPFGLPKEAYGFSREARGRFGPPPFTAAAFDLTPIGTHQVITLR